MQIKNEFVIRYNELEFNPDEIERLKKFIQRIPNYDLIQGTKFFYKGILFAVIGIQYHLEKSLKVIEVNQVTTKQKVKPING